MALAALAYGVLMTLLICIPAWPGQMNYDGLYAYERSIRGIEHMTWPPMHSYLFWLSRTLGAGAGGVFAGQVLLLFFASGLAASIVIRSRLWALAAMAAFALAFLIVTPMWGVAIVQWRDVTVTSFAMGSVALWLLAAQRRQAWLLVPAALLLGLSVSLRYNAFPLFALIAPLMVWRPLLVPGAGASLRALAAAAVVISVGLAWASTQWRLPDLKRMPAAGTLAQIQLFDLLGVSACADRSFLPLSVTDGYPITAAQIREAYDPRHVQMAHEPTSTAPAILKGDNDGGRAIGRAWREAIPKNLGCYLDHRRIVMVEQLGMAKGTVFYATHLGIDENPHGLAPAHPELIARIQHYITHSAGEAWRRPAILYLLATLVTGLLALGRDRRTPLMLALLGGAYANLALLALIAPAADARYIFPSNVFCAFLIAAGVGMLIEGPAAKKGRP